MRTRTKKAAEATLTFPPPAAAREPAPLERAALDFGERWAPASEVLEWIRAVRTRFLGFNRAARVGGIPIDRVTVVSGATHGGKTLYLLGLLYSFLEAGHIAAFIDAEGTTPQEFAAELMGDIKRMPRFIAPPGVLTFERAIDAVSDLVDGLAKHRAKEPNLCGIVVVDSVTKLAPKGELDKVKKKHAEELTKGHHGRGRASVIQSWLDNLTPRLRGSNLAVVLVAQERDLGIDEGGKRPAGVADGTDWLEPGVKMKGGKSLEFDSSLLVRVTKSEPVLLDPTDKRSAIVGWKHRVRIRKSKVAHMDGYFSESFFHVSNGAGDTPAGFDVARDALEVGTDVGVVKLDGAWYKWAPRSGGAMKKWQGGRAALSYLSKHPDALAALASEVADAIDRERGRVLQPSGLIARTET